MAPFETIADGVHLVRIPMPGGGLPYSLAYLIEDDRGRLHVVDPGSPTADAGRALLAAVDALGRSLRDVAQIVVTHLHPDHAGGAAELRSLTGAPVLLHEREAEALAVLSRGVPAPDLDDWDVPAERRPELLASVASPLPPRVAEALRPDAVLADGELLAVPGRRIHALWTPGHTPGHLCLHDVDAGLVFTGDHVLPTINSGLGLGGPTATNPIADYLAALDRVAALDARALPGHEQPFDGLAARCAVLREHHLRRAREVAAHPGGTVWEVASTLTWTGGWDALSGFTLLSALSQTALHRDFVARGAA